MRLLLILAVGLLLAADDPKDEAKEKAVKEELKKLEGSWEVVQMERAGERLPPEKVKALNMQMIFKEKQVFSKIGGAIGGTATEASYQIDPTQEPKTIDVTDKNKDLSRGIYKLDGELLTVCSARPGRDRPTEFKTSPGSDQLLLVLKKVK
jgi:uncharacterized protein (TIGR03067 family)